MNQSSFYLMITAFAIGLRHGFDLDHLATIDAITRTSRNDLTLSKSTGLLFSLGHGLVVSLFSIIIGGGLVHFKLSHYLQILGSSISIFFLFFFGLINIYTIFRNSKINANRLKIINLVLSFIRNSRCQAIAILIIGALFAISFDTLSQVTLFALSASTMGGWLFSLFIGVLFTLGMMMADGLNGLLVAHLIYRTDKASIYISRMIGAIVGLFSLITGAIGLVTLLN